jgi:hypothetical protein
MEDLERMHGKSSEADPRSDDDSGRDAARRQLDVLRIGQLRDRLMPYAEAKGYFTDEDFFRDIS